MLGQTSRPNRLMVRYVHIVTPERDRLSGQKQNGPSGTELSLPVSSSQPVRALVNADLAADEVTSFR